MLKRSASSSADKTGERHLDVRYVGPVPGCFSLSKRRDLAAEGNNVFACRTLSLSPSEIVVTTDVRGEVGEAVTAYFDGFGIIRGTVQRRTVGGFAFDVAANLSGREKLAAKIEWLKLKSVRKQTDSRSHKRFQPRSPRSTITLADGSTEKCFVIDLSAAGAGVCAKSRPEIGTTVVLGRVPGRVVRLLEVGFAVQFHDVQDAASVEGLATGHALADGQAQRLA